MSAMSDYLENKVRDLVLRATAFTAPATVYLAVFSTATTDAGGGTEATGGSYARQIVTFNAPSTGLAESAATVTFTNMPAGTWSHAAIMDALTVGNMLLHGPLTAPVVTAAGNNLSFTAADIDATFA